MLLFILYIIEIPIEESDNFDTYHNLSGREE